MDPATMAMLAQTATSLLGGIFGNESKGDKFKKLDVQSPGQKKLSSNIFGQLQGMRQGGYGQAVDYYTQMLDPNSQAYQNFGRTISKPI